MIKAIIESVNSKSDMYGNRYFFMRYTDTKSGKTIEGNISGGESNIRSIIREMGLEYSDVYFNTIELPIREYNRQSKGLEYAGCRAEEIVKFINTHINQ
jgi:hypothetical protein